MPPVPPKQDSLLKRLWNAFRGSAPTDGTLQGSQYPARMSAARRNTERYLFEIPEIPLRPIANDLANSYELIELKTWCPEARHSTSIIARDCFQRVDGRTGSWEMAKTLEDGTPVHPDVLAIGRDIAQRKCGKTPVLGGDRLQRAVREMIWAGDSFLEFSIDREGTSRNDYGIKETLYLPPLSVFVDEDEHGRSNGYWQRSRQLPSPDDTWIHPLKCLQFTFEEQSLYGSPLLMQSLEPWRKCKKVSIDIEEACRALGVAPWLHVMPPDRDEQYKLAYQDALLNERQDSIITDLFLMNGADVKRATADSGVLAPLIESWIKYRYQCIPPSVPIWLFPGMGLESGAGKDLANQPALAYTRLIAAMRAIVGEQIKWAVSVEIVLKKGFDWYLENGAFDISWGDWFVTGLEAGLMSQDGEAPKQPPPEEIESEEEEGEPTTDWRKFLQGVGMNGFS